LRKLASTLVMAIGLFGAQAAFAQTDAAIVPDAPPQADAATGTTDDDDGCGCHVGGTSTLGGGAALLGLAGLGLALVRRRR
jgi:MYXO-CTERM domain-containing protein